MILCFVLDAGFSENNGRYYCSNVNRRLLLKFKRYFDKIIVVGRRTEHETSNISIDIDNVDVSLVDSVASLGGIFKNYSNVNKVIDASVRECDVVFYLGINGLIAFKKAKKYEKIRVAFVGGCVFETLIKIGSLSKKILSPIIYLLIKNSIKHAHYAHYVADYLIKRYPTCGEYIVCSDVSIKESTQEDKLIRHEKIFSEKDKIVIGLIGYVNNRIKGVDTAIKALSFLSNEYYLKIIGRGDHIWLDNICNELGVHDRVEFCGVLPGGEAIWNWLDNIDIYIQPSLTEGLPRATLEAMSRGCPVITSHAGGLKDLVSSDRRHKSGDYKRLASLINEIALDKTKMFNSAQTSYDLAKEFNNSIIQMKFDVFWTKILQSVNRSDL